MHSHHMVIYEKEFERIQASVSKLVEAANARVVFVVDKNGQLIASSGEAARIINEAKTEKWQRIIEARADAKRFLAMLNAHRLAPKYYTHRLYYRALAEGLKESRIFILPGDSEIRVNHEQFSTGIDDILNSQ